MEKEIFLLLWHLLTGCWLCLWLPPGLEVCSSPGRAKPDPHRCPDTCDECSVFISLQTRILFQLISTGCALNLLPTEIAAQSLSLTHAMPLIVTCEVCAWAPGPQAGSGPETEMGREFQGIQHPDPIFLLPRADPSELTERTSRACVK